LDGSAYSAARELQDLAQGPKRDRDRARERLRAAAQARGLDRLNVVADIVDDLDLPLVREAFEVVHAVGEEPSAPFRAEFRIGEVVDALAARLTELGSPEEALDHIWRLSIASDGWESPQEIALLNHIRRMTEAGYLDEAHRVVDGLFDTSHPGGSQRAGPLTDLAPRYVRAGAVRTGLTTALAIRNDDERATALGAFALAAADEPPGSVLTCLEIVLRRGTSISRQSLFADLRGVAPLFARVGGRDAVRAILEAADDTARWWP
jgi:hypothetical protein